MSDYNVSASMMSCIEQSVRKAGSGGETRKQLLAWDVALYGTQAQRATQMIQETTAMGPTSTRAMTQMATRTSRQEKAPTRTGRNGLYLYIHL